MAKDPKAPKVPPPTEYDSALGPIPPDHFDDDLPFSEAEGPGVDHARELIKDGQRKAKTP